MGPLKAPGSSMDRAGVLPFRAASRSIRGVVDALERLHTHCQPGFDTRSAPDTLPQPRISAACARAPRAEATRRPPLRSAPPRRARASTPHLLVAPQETAAHSSFESTVSQRADEAHAFITADAMRTKQKQSLQQVPPAPPCVDRVRIKHRAPHIDTGPILGVDRRSPPPRSKCASTRRSHLPEPPQRRSPDRPHASTPDPPFWSSPERPHVDPGSALDRPRVDPDRPQTNP